MLEPAPGPPPDRFRPSAFPGPARCSSHVSAQPGNSQPRPPHRPGPAPWLDTKELRHKLASSDTAPGGRGHAGHPRSARRDHGTCGRRPPGGGSCSAEGRLLSRGAAERGGRRPTQLGGCKEVAAVQARDRAALGCSLLRPHHACRLPDPRGGVRWHRPGGPVPEPSALEAAPGRAGHAACRPALPAGQGPAAPGARAAGRRRQRQALAGRPGGRRARPAGSEALGAAARGRPDGAAEEGAPAGRVGAQAGPRLSPAAPCCLVLRARCLLPPGQEAHGSHLPSSALPTRRGLEGSRKLQAAGVHLPAAPGLVRGPAAVRLPAEAAGAAGVEAASGPVSPQEPRGRESRFQELPVHPVPGGAQTLHSHALRPPLLLGVHHPVVRHQDGVPSLQGEVPSPEARVSAALPLT